MTIIIMLSLWVSPNSYFGYDKVYRSEEADILASHSSSSAAEPVQHHTVKSWHHMECGCRLGVKSSDTHLSCWAQMRRSTPHTHCVTHSYCTLAHKNVCCLRVHKQIPLSSVLRLCKADTSVCCSDERRPPVWDDNRSPGDATEMGARGHG